MSFDHFSPRQPSISQSRRSADRGAVAVALTVPGEDRRFFAVWVALLTATLFALMSTRASGQNGNQAFPYDSIEMHPALQNESTRRSVQTATKTFAMSGQGNPASVNGYFAFYVPARITAPDGVKHIPELIDEARNYLGRAERANRSQVLATLTRYIFDGMEKVATGNHHPAARIAAISLLGDLNSRPANLQNRTAPVPLKKALPILLSLYEDQSNVDGIRAAALHGIHRHVLYGFPQIDPPDRAKITTLANDLLDSPAPSGRPERAHAYLQRFAVDILETLKTAEDKTLATKLVSISTTDDQPDLIALYSAARLANLSSDLQGQVKDPQKILESWSKRLLESIQEEVARLEGLERPRTMVSQPRKPEEFLERRTERKKGRTPGGRMGGSSGGMEMADNTEQMMEQAMQGMDSEEFDTPMMEGLSGMGGMGGMMGVQPAKTQPPEVRLSRTKLNSILQHLHLGATGKPTTGIPSRNPGGLLASVSDEQKAAIEAWVTSVEELVTNLNDENLDTREKYIEGLEVQASVLQGLLGDAEAAAEAADAANELDEVGIAG